MRNTIDLFLGIPKKIGRETMKEEKKLIQAANGPSLEEINNTVAIPKNGSFWRNLLAFSGPGALVAVGYMDRC